MNSRALLAWLLLITACGRWPGGGVGVVLGPTSQAKREACDARRVKTVTPTFTPAEALTPPTSTRTADGTLVTDVGFRLRPGRERTATGGAYPAQSFAGRHARLRIEDGVAAGRAEVKVSLSTSLDLSPNGPRVQFRAFRPSTAGSITTWNVTMTLLGPRQAERLVLDNAREGRPLARGDVLDFELELFFAGFDARDPMPVTGPDQGYSDTFRYRVGEGALVPEPFDDDAPVASGARGWLGGGLTVPFIAARDGTPIGGATAWQQAGLSVSSSALGEFLDGRRLFFTDVSTGAHQEPGNTPLPVDSATLVDTFNARRCSTCHRLFGRGALESMVFFTDGAFGPVLQQQELATTVSGFDDVRTETLASGRTVTLRRPRLTAVAEASPRLAPALAGLGLLEAVDEASVLALADEEDCDGDGISGRPSTVDSRLGRFGWKSSFATLADVVAHEGLEQLGVRLDAAQGRALTSTLQVSGVPAQRGGATSLVLRGEQVFTEVRCNACHVERLETGDRHPLAELRRQPIRPFSDLLLHELGEGEWRTAPLWGLGVARVVHGERHLMHDGRASTVLEAIVWHGGEAATSVEAVKALGADELDALLAFLDSL